MGRTFAELASHVTTLLADSQAGARLADEARCYVESNHSPPFVAARVRSLLSDAAEAAESAHSAGPQPVPGRIPASRSASAEANSPG